MCIRDRFVTQWHSYNNDTDALVVIGGTGAALQLPETAAAAPMDSYWAAQVWQDDPEFSVFVYVRKEADGYKVVGVDRNWTDKVIVAPVEPEDPDFSLYANRDAARQALPDDPARRDNETTGRSLTTHERVEQAARDDSRRLDERIEADNTPSQLWGDSAYRSAETERSLGEKGYRSHIHHKGNRGKPLTERQKKANKTRSKIRVRVEHVFGFQERSMGGKLIRTIGMARAKAKIGMMNLVYNMSRLVQFERGAAAPG